MSFLTASVVGIPSKTTWSSTAVLKAGEIEVWLACGFTGSEDAPHQGRKFLKYVEESEFLDFASFYASFQEFLSSIDSDTVPSLACIFRQEEKLLLLTHGFGSIGFVRKNQLRWLADGSQQSIVLQGELKLGDFFVLGTARANDLMPAENLLLSADPDALTASLFSPVQRHDESGEIAFLFVRSRGQRGAESQSFSIPSHDQETETKTSREENVPMPSLQHLISPTKLEEGILASQEEQSQATQKSNRWEWWETWWQHSRKNIHWIRALVVIGVLSSVVLGLLLYRTMSIQAEQQRVLQPLEELSKQVRSYDETQRVRQREEASSLLERMKSTKIVYNTNSRRLEQLLLETEKFYNSISGEKNLVNLPVYYDFRLIQASFLASRGSREKTQSVFLDTSSNSLIRLDLGLKRHEALPSEGLASSGDLALVGGVNYILAGSSIRSLSPDAAKTELHAALPAAGDYSALDAFGENLYVLDRGRQQIWRLGMEAESSPSGWVRAARGVDFSRISSLSIDGSIWLGSQNGDIFKLTRGERETFALQGLADPFTSTVFLAVNPQGEKLVVVEPSKQRLVVFDKQGNYQQQVLSQQLGAVTDIFLSEDERSVFLVAGSLIYQVEF